MTAKHNLETPTDQRETAATVERSLIASIVISPEEFSAASSLVAPYMFQAYQDEAEKVWDMLEDDGQIVFAQLGKVREWLKETETNAIPQNCRFVFNQWRRKREVELSDEQQERLSIGQDPEDVLADIEAKRDLIREWIPEEFKPKDQRISNLVDSMGSNPDHKQKGILTGFAGLDTPTGGLTEGDQIILAGRPGMGKTNIALCIGRYASETKTPCAFFSMEMTEDELTMRLLSQYSGIGASKQRWARKVGNQLSKDDFNEMVDASGKLHDLPLAIIDNKRKLSDIVRTYRKLAVKHGVKLFFFDYLQLIDGEPRKGENREQEVSRISRTLKRLAQQYKTVNIPLAQLSRSVESRGGDKRPMLSDLRDSGGIEQDADMVLFAYRPEYYGIEQDEFGNSTKGIGELLCAKDRHNSGLLGNSVKLQFVPGFEKYKDFEEVDPVASQFPVAENNRIEKAGDFGDDDEIPF